MGKTQIELANALGVKQPTVAVLDCHVAVQLTVTVGKWIATASAKPRNDFSRELF